MRALKRARLKLFISAGTCLGVLAIIGWSYTERGHRAFPGIQRSSRSGDRYMFYVLDGVAYVQRSEWLSPLPPNSGPISTNPSFDFNFAGIHGSESHQMRRANPPDTTVYGRDRYFGVSLWWAWLTSLVIFAFSAKAWFKRSPMNDGLCPKCGYDLRATPDRCPECGIVPVKPTN